MATPAEISLAMSADQREEWNRLRVAAWVAADRLRDFALRADVPGLFEVADGVRNEMERVPLFGEGEASYFAG